VYLAARRAKGCPRKTAEWSALAKPLCGMLRDALAGSVSLPSTSTEKDHDDTPLAIHPLQLSDTARQFTTST